MPSTLRTAPAQRDWAALRASVTGQVALPGSSYERLRRPAVTNFHDVRPRAVVTCRIPDDVAETIQFARRHGLPVAPRSGGHCFAGRSSTQGIVADVLPMSAVDVTTGEVTAGAGARLGNIYFVLDAAGVTVPAGCGPDVGIAGLTLGGGFGVLGHTHGLTCDRLLSASVVLADGRVVDCDQGHHADLYWALRAAGGGNFGVVTSLTPATRPPHRAVPAQALGGCQIRSVSAQQRCGECLAAPVIGNRSPLGIGRRVPELPDPDLTGWARAYHGPNLERRQHVKATYDPGGFFRFHQAIRSPHGRRR